MLNIGDRIILTKKAKTSIKIKGEVIYTNKNFFTIRDDKFKQNESFQHIEIDMGRIQVKKIEETND